jgi:hypothetical protein
LKKPLCQYIIIIIVGFNQLIAKAQVVFEQVRNTEPVTYYVNNPFGNNAAFTWTITGGTIAGHSSPYTAVGADTIEVIWNDSNRTSANYGSLMVSEIVKWPGGSTCSSEEENINVESWVQPKAATDFADLIVCTGEAFVVRVNFEGKPGYKYKWKLYDKENPETIIEDHTAEFVSCIDTSTDIVIAGIENNNTTEKMYEFEITDVQDAFTDGMPGNVSMGSVTVYVQPKTPAGILKSNSHLIRRL